MKTFVMETFSGQFGWCTIPELAKIRKCSVKTIRERKKEMMAEIGKRYKIPAVIDSKPILINLYAFLDFECNREALMDKNRRKHVQPFNVSDWVEYSGAFSRPVREVEEWEKDTDAEDTAV